jgi:hypothetical protein
MSDTHGRLDAIDRAVERLNQEEVEFVLHAGDFVSPFTAAMFKPLKAKMLAVYGNNDGDRPMLRSKLGEIGTELARDFAELELDGKRIALLHGTDERIVDSVVKSGLYQVVVRGHTRRAEIREDSALQVNSGEVCGYLTGHQTIAVLELP